MGKKTFIAPIQKRFLELVVKEPYLVRRYYWTGGTVLAEFYLHHRESYDVDLFSEKEVYLPSISKFIGIAAARLGAEKITHQRFLGLHSFFFHFPKDKILKVDFNYYPFPRIEKGKKWQGLEVDSLLDIAVNKIHTISLKPRARDFVDIYFILQKKEFTLEKLVDLAKAKFDWHIAPLQLGENFAKVVTLSDFPKMYMPFDRKEMEDFFLKLAKNLEKKIFK